MSEFQLPNVAGRRIRSSNDDFERACLVHIERLQCSMNNPYDDAMLDTFCEAVRLVREYNDSVKVSPDATSKVLLTKESTLRGHWRHSNGTIFCGTLRIARGDFDTNPAPEFCARVFDDICERMNADTKGTSA